MCSSCVVELKYVVVAGGGGAGGGGGVMEHHNGVARVGVIR